MLFLTKSAEHFTTTHMLLSSHHVENNCYSSSGESRQKWYTTDYI